MALLETTISEDFTVTQIEKDSAEKSARMFEPERLDPSLSSQVVTEADPLWDRAERFVYALFRLSGFCSESPREWVEETQPWRENSRLHVITEADGLVTGVARTMIGRYQDLPVSQFSPTIEIPTGMLCEIGSLAVRPTQRGLGVANELHRTAFQYGIRQGVQGFVFLIDEWMFKFFESHYGLPVLALAPPQEFMGGVVVPTAMWLPDMMQQLVRTRPNVFKWSIEGFEPRTISELDLPILLD
ncbi:MAG: GNAT family N-acetyltransferase [Microthrixaceae bacterium]